MLGFEFFGHACEIDDVGEKYGQLPALCASDLFIAGFHQRIDHCFRDEARQIAGQRRQRRVGLRQFFLAGVGQLDQPVKLSCLTPELCQERLGGGPKRILVRRFRRQQCVEPGDQRFGLSRHRDRGSPPPHD